MWNSNGPSWRYGCDCFASSERMALVSPESEVTASWTTGLCRKWRVCQMSTSLLVGIAEIKGRALQESRVAALGTCFLLIGSGRREGPRDSSEGSSEGFTHPVKHLCWTLIAFLLFRPISGLADP